MASRDVPLSFAAVLVSQLCFVGVTAAQVPAVGEPKPPDDQTAAQPDTTQATEAEAGQPRRKRAAEEEITVTGSRVRRKDLTTPAPITVISKEQVQASGKVSIGDFLQSLPEQGNAINTSVNNGGNGATRVSLRGLGVERTLVLLNGRRFVPGGNGANSSVDLNSIPTAAVERIEVLKDGASAVYGSDAIGGVINLITRKKYNGADVTGYTGTSTHADGTIYDINATAGTSGERGSFLFSGGYYQQKSVLAGDRTFPGSNIPVALSATQGQISQGSTTVPAGTIVLPACPRSGPVPGCVGTPYPNPGNDPRLAAYNQLVLANPTTATFIRDQDTGTFRAFKGALLPENGGDGYNFQPENYLVTPQQRISLFSTGDTRLGSSARAYIEGSYVNRQSDQKLAAEPLLTDVEGITVSKDNFYNPFGADFGAVRRRLLEFGNRRTAQDIDTFRVVGGVDGTLPDEAGPVKGWFWDLSINYGRTEGTVVKTGNLKRPNLAAALGPSMPINGVPTCVSRAGDPTSAIAGCVPLNLFGGPGTISPDQITNLTFTGNLRGTNQMTAFNFNTAGELFKLLADRPVGLALGYEYRFLTGENIPDPITVAGDTTGNKGEITKGHYYANEGYGELSLPIVNNLPGAENIEATAAARVFNYSTFGTDATYKFGGRWTLVRDFTVRGTYSTGFRAPSISDLFLGQADSFPPVSDPCRGPSVPNAGPAPASCGAAANNGDAQTQLRARIGGNPLLQAETAKIYTAGVVFEPRWVKNLSMTLDYYNVTVNQSITTIGSSVILASCYPSDAQAAAGAVPKYCDKIQRDPVTQRITNISDTNVNVGQDATDGIDVALNYALPTEYGRFGFIFDGTWLHKFDRTLADGTVIRGRGNFDLNSQGTGGVYPNFKFVSGVRWSFKGLDLGVNTRFLSSFIECGTPAGIFNGSGLCYVDRGNKRDVEAYNTWDVFASYVFGTPAGRTTLGAGVTNVFNRAPAVIYNGFTAASDPTAYSDGFIGRFFYARVGQAF